MSLQDWKLNCIQTNTLAFSSKDKIEIADYLKEKKTLTELAEHTQILVIQLLKTVVPELKKQQLLTETEWFQIIMDSPEELMRIILEKIEQLIQLSVLEENENLKLNNLVCNLRMQEFKEGNDVFQTSNNCIVNEDGIILKKGKGGSLSDELKNIYQQGVSIEKLGIQWESETFKKARQRAIQTPGKQIKLKNNILKTNGLYFAFKIAYQKRTGNFSLFIEDISETYRQKEIFLNNPHIVCRLDRSGLVMDLEDLNPAFKKIFPHVKIGNSIFQILKSLSPEAIVNLPLGEFLHFEEKIVLENGSEATFAFDLEISKEFPDTIFLYSFDISRRIELIETIETKNKELYLKNQELQRLMQENEEKTNRLTEIMEELQEKNKEMGILMQELKELATTDGLTKLTNRREFERILKNEIKRAKRHTTPERLSLIMLDIDHFKSFNDNYGHIAGDETLKNVAQTLKENLRETDMIARYGGEEFIILLRETPLEGAVILAEKLRQRIEEIENKVATNEGGKKIIPVKISLGVTSYSPSDKADDFSSKADQALYYAKENGRNRVAINQNNFLGLAN